MKEPPFKMLPSHASLECSNPPCLGFLEDTDHGPSRNKTHNAEYNMVPAGEAPFSICFIQVEIPMVDNEKKEPRARKEPMVQGENGESECAKETI